ncbi:MAG: hypothetical protein KF760_02370 [Candidatus Eremiobacteraeota bacterium]|nr:hypothetical protein [Candidatus Eremiobacteraeota bacterium]MCW5868883.1 hypothetical protein [Candidatus Eremiobacteraeota bacterium]
MEERLLIKLFQLRRRQALVQAVERGLHWGLWGGWLCLPWLWLFAALRLDGADQLRVVWLWPALALIGLLHGLLSPWSLRRVAYAADQTHDLKERLLTCYGHLESKKPHTVVSQLLLQETLQRLDEIDPARTFPARWKRPLLRWAVPALALAAALVLAPIWLPPPPPDPLQQEVLASRQRLDRLHKRLAQRPQSLRREQLRQLLEKLPNQVPAQAARQLRQALGELQRQMDKQNEQASRLGQLAQSTPQQQREQLEKMRQQLEQQPQARSLLEQAQKALEQGHQEQAEKAMREAQQELAEGRQMAEDAELSQALEDEMKQLGGSAQPGKQDDGPSQGASGPPGGKGQGKGTKGDFGRGSTNQEGKTGEAATRKARGQRQNQQQRNKQEAFKQLYGADRKDLQTRRERVALAGAKGKLLRMADSKLGDPRLGDPGLRPDSGDFLEAKALAEQSVAEEKVPAEHREAVRRYFDNIDPRK